jgi:CRISPR-associated protein Cas5d
LSRGIKLHVWGEFACFTRPEMKVERVSYDVITPSAARGIIEAIYWKPEIRWIVTRLHILKPVRFTNLRRNEVSEKISVKVVTTVMNRGHGQLGLSVDEVDSTGKPKYRQQRAATILRDVAYVIEAEFEIIDGEDNPGKHLDQFNRRARAGQCFHRPYLGCREFPAEFALVEDQRHPMPACELPADQRDRDLGYILHDIDFADDMTPRFFRAEMKAGAVDVPPFQSEAVKR